MSAPTPALTAVFADWLKKQGGNVIMLCLGIVWLYNYMNAETVRLRSKVEQIEKKTETLQHELIECNTERARLESRVEWLVSELSNRFPRLKKSADER